MASLSLLVRMRQAIAKRWCSHEPNRSMYARLYAMCAPKVNGRSPYEHAPTQRSWHVSRERQTVGTARQYTLDAGMRRWPTAAWGSVIDPAGMRRPQDNPRVE